MLDNKDEEDVTATLESHSPAEATDRQTNVSIQRGGERRGLLDRDVRYQVI